MEQTQSTTARSPKPFQLGLALAGAISAGAYTAGVLDFLFQALSAWEERRGQAGVLQHRVVLKVMAGASAGAITGALGAIGLARGLQPRLFDADHYQICYPDTYPKRQKIECVIPSLRQIWVELPAMISADGVGGLLGTDDIKAAGPRDPPILRSLLNASLLDDIKRIAIEPQREPGTVVPPVPFVANDLHVYITVSNLRGIPFKVAFGRNSYGMQTIGDRIHYVVRDLGSCDLSEAGSWVERDSHLPISVRTLPAQRDGNLSEWDLYGTSALASGAYPVGLASRKLGFAWDQYLRRSYPIPAGFDVDIQPVFPIVPPDAAAPSKEFVFESVDGGLVNNDPFDYAQYALFGGPAKGPESGSSVERAILMVAPFPEAPEFLPEGSPSSSITSILLSLLPSLVNQARFRASELAPAVSERDFSRFLIVPLRRIPRTSPLENPPDIPLERFAIACGLLGGFGGFLDEKFRAHDFQLGRRNCQQFLRKSFLMPADNVIVGRPGATEQQPVIPLVDSAADPIPLPKWPRMTRDDFDRLCDRISKRIDLIAPHFVDAQTRSVKLRTALKFGWRRFLRDHAVGYIQQTILADLVRREQIEGWDPPLPFDPPAPSPGEVAAVIAELINPSFDLRTARGIARATRLQPDIVIRILGVLSDRRVPQAARAWGANGQYTLYARRPGFFERWRYTGWIARWWNAPTVN
jgi:predicted acylesterase/phospholipase RssA